MAGHPPEQALSILKVSVIGGVGVGIIVGVTVRAAVILVPLIGSMGK